MARDLAFSPADVTITAGADGRPPFRNDDPVFHDWEVEGVANVDAGARPGQTQRIRFTDRSSPGPTAIRVHRRRATPRPGWSARSSSSAAD